METYQMLQLSFHILTDNNDYWDIVIPESSTFKAEHSQLNINYQTSLIPFIDLE